jgi:hypothetical protein
MTNAKTVSIAANIFRCSALQSAQHSANHPCHSVAIVQYQDSLTQMSAAGKGPAIHRRTDEMRVPEPWRGDIEHAALLFLVGNLPQNLSDDSPHAGQSDAQIAGFYCSRHFEKHFPFASPTAGSPRRKPAPLWLGIRKRAEELYDRKNPVAGKDYALTALVHCNARAQAGVAAAAEHCAQRHLAHVLSVAHPKVIVCLGKLAWYALENFQWGESAAPLILALPHPGSRQPRTTAVLATPALQEAQALLGGSSEPSRGALAITAPPQTQALMPEALTQSRRRKHPEQALR